MNKLMPKLKPSSFKGKQLYLFLLLVFLVGILFGSIFITILNEQDKSTVITQITSFFDQIKNNKTDYLNVFKNGLTSNLIYIVAIWLLGISIIGIPIIIMMLFLKGFVIGFSIAAIIAKYKLIGILGALTYIFPHVIIFVLVIFMMSYYSLKLSFGLLRAVIERKSIHFSEIINRYSFAMLISIIIVVIGSAIETFISPYIIKLFLIFI
ncbi:MAG: stage II sporulation protein M [Bacilli bacterium]|nr:stage II sporulation protein M [Bacilli bacterium]MDD4054047.1 stage II sporulation protein M [Bacilli bacterium]MDD4411821.1 stage II sporulation protein M [Bacilli bacterium]